MSERETQEALKLLSAKSEQYAAERKINRQLVATLKEIRPAIADWYVEAVDFIENDKEHILAKIDEALKAAGTP